MRKTGYHKDSTKNIKKGLVTVKRLRCAKGYWEMALNTYIWRRQAGLPFVVLPR